MKILLNDPSMGLVLVSAIELYYEDGKLVLNGLDYMFEFPMNQYSAELLILKAFTTGHLDLREFLPLEDTE